MEDNMRDFTKEIECGELFSFLLPILLVKFLEIFSNILSPVFVNRLLSPDAVTCLSACRVYSMLQSNLVGVTAAGFGVYVIRNIGGNSRTGQQEAMAQALTGAGVLALIGFLLLFMQDLLLMAARIPDHIGEQAKSYLFWLSAGAAALVCHSLFLSIVCGLGESAFAGRMSMMGVVLQPCLTYFLIRHMGLGIAAIPIADMLNRLIMAFGLLGRLWRKYTYLFGRLAVSFENGWELWSCGLSHALMLTLVWLGTFMIQREINQMPGVYISAYLYATMTEDLLLFGVFGCREAASSVLAPSAGSGNAALVRRYFRRMNRIGWGFCLAAAGVIWIWGDRLVRLFLGNAEEEVIRLTLRWLQICTFAFPGLSLGELSRPLLQAVGAYRFMWLLGVFNGLLRGGLAVLVIADSGFDALIGSFFCMFLAVGAAGGLCCRIALKRFEGERMK